MKIIKIKDTPKEPQVRPLFTGPVDQQTFIGPELSKNFAVRQVNFEKGVRNKFHAHTIEQVLIITEGKGIVATENEEVEVEPGDIVFFNAGEKHWHGATKDSTFSHIYVMHPDQKTTQLEE